MMARWINWMAQRWLLLLIVLWGSFVWLPWLAPILMRFGWQTVAEWIYLFYSITCHQLPQRSFFLFGTQGMYELEAVQAVVGQTTNMWTLRQFIGTPEMGWKVAWSDRMVSFYGGIWLWLIVWYLVPRRWLPRISLLGFALLAWPMMLDGTTHMISDIFGTIGSGFRDTNEWLALLTANAFSTAFYAGDSLGTFNSWMRLITGLLFSFGLVGWAVPLLRAEFSAENRRHVVKRA